MGRGPHDEDKYEALRLFVAALVGRLLARPALLMAAGVRREARGERDKALGLYREALGLDGANRGAWLALANAVSVLALQCNDLVRFKEAVGAYHHALQDHPAWEPALRGLARLYGDSGYHAEAAGILEGMVVDGQLPPDLCAGYASALDKLGNPELALHWNAKAGDGSPDLRLRSARLHATLGDHSAVAKELGQLVDAFPEWRDRARDVEVLSLARSGRLAQARDLHEQGGGLSRETIKPQGLVAPRQRDGAIRIVLAVWGAEYVASFLATCLPSQLSPGNIPAIAESGQTSYRIYTTAEGANLLRASETFSALTGTLPVELLTFPLPADGKASKYDIANLCHRHAVLDANLDGDTIIFLSPDSLISDGCLVRLAELRSQGVEAVMISGLRVTKESALPETLRLANAGSFRGAPALALLPRDMVKVILGHSHHSMGGSFLDAGFVNDFWSSLCVRANGSGLLLRQLHLHPLMVTPADRTMVPEGTIDATYVGEACGDWSRIHVVEDSDELCGISWSSRSENRHMMVYEEKPYSKAAWVAYLARRHITPFNLSLLRHRIRFHVDGTWRDWTDEEAASDRVVEEVLGEFGAR